LKVYTGNLGSTIVQVAMSVIQEAKQHFSTKFGRFVNRRPRTTHYCTFLQDVIGL
jgi:hypothetical protein